MGEFSPGRVVFGFIDADDLRLDELHRACHEITREAIVAWLSRMTPDLPEQDTEQAP